MKISVFYDHVRKAAGQCGLPIEEILARAKGWGISALECSVDDFKGREKAFARTLSDVGMAVSSVHAFFDFGDKADAEGGRALVDAAAYFGADKVLAIPGFLRGADPASRGREIDRMAVALSDLCAYARTRKIAVTLEDYDDTSSPVASADGLLDFFSRVPDLRCTFDTGNFMFNGHDELEAFARLSGRVVHVHCKDRSLAGAAGDEAKLAADGRTLYPAPVGAGIVKMERIVGLLRGSGYDGYFAIEHFGANDQLSFIERSAAWLMARA